MRNYFLIIFFIPVLVFSGTTGKISGKITDAATNESLIGANIILVGTGLGAATDIDGNYVILNIPPGVYTLRISMVSYRTAIVEDVKIAADQTTNISLELESADLELEEIVVSAETPLVQKDLTSSISVMTRDGIEELPVASFTELLQLQEGVVGSGNNLHIRGGRSNEVAYMEEGM